MGTEISKTSFLVYRVFRLMNGAGLLIVKKDLQKVPATISNKPKSFQ